MALPNLSDAALQQTNALTSKFGGFAQDVSSSCDIMGTIGSIKDKITQYITDEVTGAVTAVQVAVSEVMSDIKDKLSSCFAGSGSVLNSVKGYIAQAQSIAAEIAAKASQISTAVMAQLQSLMDSINSGIAYVTTAVSNAITAVTDTMNAVRGKLADAVAGIKMGMCSTMAAVLAGTPGDAFANITNGATDAATASLGAVKGIYNTGATDLMSVTGAVAEQAGVSTVVNGLQGAAATGANIASGVVGSTTAGIGNSITGMRTILAGIV